MRSLPKTLVSRAYDLSKYLAQEDGKTYRVVEQDGNPILRHVKQQSDWQEYNGENKKELPSNYVGSYSMVDVTEFLKQRGATWNQFATNEGGIKDQFLQWALRERARFFNPAFRNRMIKR